MCGRARCALAPDELVTATGLPRQRWAHGLRKYKPSNNVTPGHWTPVMRMADSGSGGDDGTSSREGVPGETELLAMKWGLVPSWVKPGDKHDHWKMFNARVESLREKPVFKRLMGGGSSQPEGTGQQGGGNGQHGGPGGHDRGRRCVVLVNGFYEWKKEGSKKQPYYIGLQNQHVMYLAGLYDTCAAPAANQPAGEVEDTLYTYTIVTTDGTSSPLAWLHDRMPLILPDRAAADAWLHNGDLPNNEGAKAAATSLTWHPVTLAMTDPSYNAADCYKDVRKSKGSISSFFSKSKAVAAPSAAGHAAEAVATADKDTDKDEPCGQEAKRRRLGA